MLTLKDKKEKKDWEGMGSAGDIYFVIGWISGTVKCWKEKRISSERAMDDIREILEEYNRLSDEKLERMKAEIRGEK